jgi:hypothetical protein
MSRPSRIKQLYHEIRETLGSEICSKEALQLAAHLVDVADGRDVLPGGLFGEQRATFDELPVDEAIADGGWRLLNRERDIVRALFDGEEAFVRRKQHYKSIELELAA